jgi:hypothetical protein
MKEYTEGMKKKFLGLRRKWFRQDQSGVITRAPRDLIVYKKTSLTVDGDTFALTTLRIPKDTRVRWSRWGDKCRATKAVVVSNEKIGGGAKVPYPTRSLYAPSFKYEVGKTVRPTNDFNRIRSSLCGGGIHFFLTKKEARAFEW